MYGCRGEVQQQQAQLGRETRSTARSVSGKSTWGGQGDGAGSPCSSASCEHPPAKRVSLRTLGKGFLRAREMQPQLWGGKS